jgi:hypothetical protein
LAEFSRYSPTLGFEWGLETDYRWLYLNAFKVRKSLMKAKESSTFLRSRSGTSGTQVSLRLSSSHWPQTVPSFTRLHTLSWSQGLNPSFNHNPNQSSQLWRSICVEHKPEMEGNGHSRHTTGSWLWLFWTKRVS